MYLALRERGFLVRHLKDARILDYVRITVGADADMTALIGATTEILEDKQ